MVIVEKVFGRGGGIFVVFFRLYVVWVVERFKFFYYCFVEDGYFKWFFIYLRLLVKFVKK